VADRFDPFAAFIHAGIGANGANNGIGGGRDVIGVFDDMAESGAEIASALIEKAERVRVAIDGAPADVVMMRNRIRTRPVEEFFFDGRAEWMLADRAVAAMVIERPIAAEREAPRKFSFVFVGSRWRCGLLGRRRGRRGGWVWRLVGGCQVGAGREPLGRPSCDVGVVE